MLSFSDWKTKVEREVHYLSSAESILFPGAAADFLGFPIEHGEDGQIDGAARKDWALSHLRR